MPTYTLLKDFSLLLATNNSVLLEAGRSSTRARRRLVWLGNLCMVKLVAAGTLQLRLRIPSHTCSFTGSVGLNQEPRDRKWSAREHGIGEVKRR